MVTFSSRTEKPEIKQDPEGREGNQDDVSSE